MINKPQLKRFEMHGNLPAVLQHGIVVSASKLPKQSEEVYGYIRRTESEYKRAPEGGATTANTHRNMNKRYTWRI